MKRKKPNTTVMQNLVMLTQLGLSLVTPPLVFIGLAVWLRSKFAFGIWIILVAILVGMLTSFGTALTFFRKSIRDAEQDAPHRAAGFDSHD